jgi:hypothetical protein
MATKVSDINNGSEQPLEFSFQTSTGGSVIPNSVAYTVKNERGSIINSRDGTGITPNSTINLTLSTADCDYDDGRQRFVTVRWDYDASYGTGLVQVDECYFNILQTGP